MKQGILNLLKYNKINSIKYILIKLISLMFLNGIFNYLININYLFIILCFIILLVYSFIDLVSLILFIDQSRQKYNLSIVSLYKKSINRFINIFKNNNLCYLFISILYCPLLFIIINYFSFINYNLVNLGFILNIKNILIFIFIVFIILLLYFLLYKYFYSIYYYVLDEIDYKEARIRSKNLIGKNTVKDFINLFINKLCYILFSIILFTIVSLIFYLLLIIIRNDYLVNIYVYIIYIISFLLLIYYSYISIVFTSSLFYKHKVKKYELIYDINIPDNKLIISNIILVIMIIIFTYFGFKNFIYYNIFDRSDSSIYSDVTITAHRGDSINNPENTLSSLESAYELDADWVEFDLAMTKDKKIILSHDLNLSRIAHINKNIIDLNYSDIKSINIGSIFNSSYHEEYIPLFEDVLKTFKDKDILLNIEIKPCGKEVDFEQSVIDLINKYNMVNQVIVTSQKYDVIKKVKQLDSNIKTYFVTSLIDYNIEKYEYADGFSINYRYINNYLVNKIHDNNKTIFAWTIDDEEIARSMIDLGVDSIITNDVNKIKNIISGYDRVTIIDKLYDLMINNI